MRKHTSLFEELQLGKGSFNVINFTKLDRKFPKLEVCVDCKKRNLSKTSFSVSGELSDDKIKGERSGATFDKYHNKLT